MYIYTYIYIYIYTIVYHTIVCYGIIYYQHLTTFQQSIGELLRTITIVTMGVFT